MILEGWSWAYGPRQSKIASQSPTCEGGNWDWKNRSQNHRYCTQCFGSHAI